MSGDPWKYKSKVYLLSLILGLPGCTDKEAKVTEKPLARVMERYLYRSDLAGLTSPGMSPEDSATITRDYIEKWIRNQLVLNKAEINLTDAEKNVEQQIENYRSSLLIYAYEQSYIRQKLDTLVPDEEVEDYYKENSANFILNEAIMRGVFIKVPARAPEIYKVRRWYRSDNPEHINELEGYCFRNATVFDHFNDSWVKLNEVLPLMPSSWATSESAILSRRYVETRDTAFYYFLNVKEIVPSGTVSPLETVKNDIRSIILNKRKIKLIYELESEIYADAQNRDHFTIYP